jgi:hypothetical protein
MINNLTVAILTCPTLTVVGIRNTMCNPATSKGRAVTFGHLTKAQKFEGRPALAQCGRCLRLGHSVGRCPKPASLIVCPLCGRPHTLAGHAHRCPLSACHPGVSCDCPVMCFLCREKGKDGSRHGALSPSCPLKAAYRSPGVPFPPSSQTVASSSRRDEVPSDAVTVPPTPITEDMEMVTDPVVLASIVGPSGSSALPPPNA